MHYLISTPTLIAVLTAPLSTQQLVIVDNLPGTFIDISNNSKPLGLGDDDEVVVQGSSIGNMVLPASSVGVVHERPIRGTDLGIMSGWVIGRPR